MFSTNPYTRRRQQTVAAFTTLSGILSAVGIQALRHSQPIQPIPKLSEPLSTFTSDGRFETTIEGDKVVIKERQVPVMVVTPLKEYQSPLNQIVEAGFTDATPPTLNIHLRLATRTADGNYLLNDRTQQVSIATLYSDKLSQLLPR